MMHLYGSSVISVLISMFHFSHCPFVLFQVPEEVQTRNDKKKLDLESELEQSRDAIRKLEAMEAE